MLLRPLPGEVEGVADDAVDADARHHGLLHHELALGVGEHTPADRRIFALGVLAHDDEVDVTGLAAGERRTHARHQPHRPQIDILIELPAELDQRAPQRDVIGHRLRPADGAEEDRVVAADLRLPIVGHHLPVREVIVAGSEFEFIDGQIEAVFFARGFEHAQTLGHHFLADAVAGNRGDPVFAGVGHERALLNKTISLFRKRRCPAQGRA